MFLMFMFIVFYVFYFQGFHDVYYDVALPSKQGDPFQNPGTKFYWFVRVSLDVSLPLAHNKLHP